ncbi:MAG: InlB B-repeat-containing protein, partial [Clostridia bacterium]|nr:InlB B-repeat-containing protein [Clostridia bacterium]
TVPEVPAKEHYTGAWGSYALIGGDITVNTVYTANEYTVTFKNGEEVVGTQTYTVENTAITVPEVPAKEYYTGVWESYELIGGDITVNTVYTANEYTVTFKNGEEVVSTQTYTVENTEITVPEVPAKQHYTSAWESYALIGGDITVNVDYTAIEYTVTFMNGEEVVGTQTYTVENTEITEPAVPVKDGYGGKWEAYALTGGDIIVNAVYTAGVYTVTFKADGITVATEEYTLENKEITVPEVPAKEGYTGVWEEYELDGGDKTVEAIYTEIPQEPESSENPEDSEDTEKPDGTSEEEPPIFDQIKAIIPGCSGVIGGVSGGIAALGIALALLLKKKED